MMRTADQRWDSASGARVAPPAADSRHRARPGIDNQ